MKSKSIIVLYSFLIVFFLLAGCNRADSRGLSHTIPDGSIVYLPWPTKEKVIGYFDTLAYKPHLIKTPDSFSKLLWQSDLQKFFGLSWYRFIGARGTPFIWGPNATDYNSQNSLIHMGDNYSVYKCSTEDVLVFLGSRKNIWVVNIMTGDEVLTLPNPVQGDKFGFGGLSYDSASDCLFAEVDSDYLELSPDDSIYCYSMDEESWNYVTFGRQPQISPDAKKLAFLRDDGLYILEFSGKSETKVLSANFSKERGIFSPYPQWSSDGEKIVLHIWNQSANKTFAKIFLLDLVNETIVDTGIEGLHPSFKD